MHLAALFFALAIPVPGTQTPAPPDRAELLRTADNQCKRKQFQEAESSYKRLIATSPDFTDAFAALGRCYLAMGRPLDAARNLGVVMQRKPDDRAAKVDLAHALVDLHRFLPAEQLLKDLLTTDPSDKESWYFLGLLMYQNGYYGSADADFEKATNASSTDPSRNIQIEIYRAVCWVHLGKAKEAEALMSTLAKNPIAQKDPDLLLVFAQLLYDTNRLESALERVDQAIQARPDLAMGYVWKGKVLYRMGRLQEAAAAEETAMHMIPQFAYPRSLLVKIYQAQGQTQKATEQVEWLRAFEARINEEATR
jgi:predicted Zn-dependent protease